ncbi:MAG: MFS transporter [Deltaproteobacteria bacterium]|nr:MFS transporter [Deltaproteobacteria bacterium]
MQKPQSVNHAAMGSGGPGMGPGRMGMGMGGPRPKMRLSAFSSLRIRNYRWLWFGMIGFFNSMQMQMVAGGWLVYTMTDSAMALGLVSAGAGVPMLLLSLVGGTVADRVRKRNLLLVTQTLIFFQMAIITILIVTDLLALWHLVIASVVSGIIFSFAMPARTAFIVDLVGQDDLLNAVALNSMAMNICRIASPALAGLLLKWIDIPGVYWVILLSYGWGMFTTIMIPPGGTMAAKAEVPMLKDMAEGLRFVRGNYYIMALMILVFVPIFTAMPFQMLMPVFARTVFQSGETGLGILMSAVGAGALVGSSIVASLGDFRRKGVLMLASGIFFGAALILFGQSNSLRAGAFFLIFVGGGSSIFMTLTNTLILSNTPKELIGRVMSIFMMTFGLMPLGVLPAGAIAEAFGAPITVIMGGGLLLVFILAATATQPRLRRLE